MRDTELTVIIPAYNEEESIESTVKRVISTMKRFGKSFEVLVVDDGSKDKTGKIIESIEGITVLNNAYNLGYGASLKKGLKHSKGKKVIITDADGTYPIEDIPKLLSYSDDYDMVVGARTGKSVKIPFMRRPAKFIIKCLANSLAKRKIIDINSGLRVFKKEHAMRFYNLYPSGFSFTTTITLSYITSDLTIKEIPINYFARKGKSSIHPIKDFVGFLMLIFRVLIYFDPLKFFLVPGILIMLAGIIYAAYQALTLVAGIGQTPVILLLSGFQIFFLGLLADLINKKR